MMLFSSSVDHNRAATPLCPDDSSSITPGHHVGFFKYPSSEHWVVIMRYASQIIQSEDDISW